MLVTFAELTHTGKVIDANNFPLAIGFLASCLKSNFDSELDIHLFKYPEDFANFLEENEPKVACFSNYMWHENLHANFASRIKERYPNVVTIFGGPNFPTDLDDQKTFLEKHPEIDFYIEGEGEVAFLELFKELKKYDFNTLALKNKKPFLSNLRYLLDGKLIHFPLCARISNIEDTIPSPYLTGLFDHFFTDKLTPMIETSRGCPYACTFCYSGSLYQNKVRRFSQERILAELNYMGERVSGASLIIADLNWGIFKDDVVTAKRLAELRKETGWPRFVGISVAKNQRDRMVEISSILKDAVVIAATIQSTDEDVLKRVKRSNIDMDKSIAMARASMKNGSATSTEIILCLPGDTYEKHIKSVLTMMDAGIDDANIFQFILLPGTEAANKKSRREYKYDTRYRVMPRCFGKYQLFGEDFSVFEIHEICVGNNTMPYDDYKRSRSLSLTISIFSDGSIFEEIFGLARVLEIEKSNLLSRIHASATEKMADIYERFHQDEERNFFANKQAMDLFIARENAVEDYLNGEYGKNQIYAYRALALTQNLADITEIAIDALVQEIEVHDKTDDLILSYIDELKNFILLRKANPFDVDSNETFWSQFDFDKIEKERFMVQPIDYKIEKTEFAVGHTKLQRTDLRKYFKQYGANIEGLTYFMHRHPARMMYRLATRV